MTTLTRPILSTVALLACVAPSVRGQITTALLDEATDIVNTGGAVVSAVHFQNPGAPDPNPLVVNGIPHTVGTASGAGLTINTTFEGDFRNGASGLPTDGSDIIQVLLSGIAGAGQISMSVAGLTPGQEYLFQAYWEHNTPGVILAATIEGDTNTSITPAASPPGTPGGNLISYQFTAGDDTLNAQFDRVDSLPGDANNWLSGYSLQTLAAAAPKLVATVPVDDSPSALVGANLKATFDKGVQPGTGSISIHRADDDSLVEALDVNDVTPPGTVTFADSEITIDPTDPLEVGVDYYVLIDATAITDATDNAFSGIADPTAWNFTGFSLGDVASELGILDLNVNGGINPATGAFWKAGDQYRLVFVTSQTTNATSTDIATYNTFVQGVAAASTTFPNLGDATWNVVGSTATVDARDNTGTNPNGATGLAVFLVDGETVVAANNSDLWDGSVQSAVVLDENATIYNPVVNRIFTGTAPDGTASTTADGPLGNSDAVRTGNSAAIDTGWISGYNHLAGGNLPVFAMSEPLTIQGSSEPPRITSITRIGTDTWELTLAGAPTTGYRFWSSPDLEFNPGTPVENLGEGDPGDPGTVGGTNNRLLTTDANGDAVVRMALAGPRNFVRAQVPPPVTLLAESFDGSAGPGLPPGWIQGRNDPPDDGTSTTVWEVGTPSNVGPIPPGVPLPSGTQCVGTDIDSNYFLPTPEGLGDPVTDVWLRTPVIDLSAFSKATLAFQYWTEIEDVPADLDRGSIVIRDASDDSELAVLENQTIDGTTSGWQAYSMALPPAAFTASSGTIRVEFRFEADDFVSFAGWYIDDVVITAPGG